MFSDDGTSSRKVLYITNIQILCYIDNKKYVESLNVSSILGTDVLSRNCRTYILRIWGEGVGGVYGTVRVIGSGRGGGLCIVSFWFISNVLLLLTYIAHHITWLVCNCAFMHVMVQNTTSPRNVPRPGPSAHSVPQIPLFKCLFFFNKYNYLVTISF